MKLLWIQIKDDDCSKMMEELKAGGYRATMISSTEDFLNYGETTLLLGVENDQCDDIVRRLKTFYELDKENVHGEIKDRVFIYVLDTKQAHVLKANRDSKLECM